jgi:hypothetical protein
MWRSDDGVALPGLLWLVTGWRLPGGVDARAMDGGGCKVDGWMRGGDEEGKQEWDMHK